MCRTLQITAPLLALAWLLPASARCEEPASGKESAHTLTGSLFVATDYRSRGLSQTFGEGFEIAPSIQGGLDYAHASGLYAGNWNYNISSNQYPNGSGIEMDFYTGYKKAIRSFTLDVGTLAYYYPRAEARGLTTRSGGTTNESFDTWELYAGGSWRDFTFRYSYSLTDYFGLSEDASVSLDHPGDRSGPLRRNGDTNGSHYMTASWTHPVSDALALTAGLGHLWVRNYQDLNVLDYRFGVIYTVQGWQIGASLVGSNADRNYYYAIDGGGAPGTHKIQEIGKPTAVFTFGRSF